MEKIESIVQKNGVTINQEIQKRNNMTDMKNSSGTVISTVLVILEILYLSCKILVDISASIFRVFLPKEEVSVIGEKILITGTGHGIGKELARQYAELGAEVICVDINPNTNKETVTELKQIGLKATAFQCDVSKKEEVEELYKKVKAEVGDVTILVNNAGIMYVKSIIDYSEEDILKMYKVNVFAHFWLIQSFLPDMLRNDKGHIVGLASVAGMIGGAYLTGYCGTKFSVVGLMEALGEELRSGGKNVKVTTILPHITDTGFCKNFKIRFSGSFGVNNPKYAASQIIKTQRKGYRETSIPSYIKLCNAVGRLLPERSQMRVIDFFDTGVFPDQINDDINKQKIM